MEKKIEKKLSKLWGKVGFIVQLSQMVEYNLANILSFDEILIEFETRNSMYVLEHNDLVKRADDLYSKLSISPLGKVIARAEQVKFFTDEGIELLREACTQRNYVVHDLFKDDLILKHIETNPDFYFKRLEATIDLLYKINEVLTDIFKKQKEEYKLIY